jgi:phosphate transport system substrate-binding protein
MEPTPFLTFEGDKFMKKLVVAGLTVLPSLFATAATAADTINAAGATFPAPIYQKWFGEYKAAHPDVQVNYQAIGSGGGIRQLTEGTVDFGASDMPMTDEQIKGVKVKPLHFPTVLGAVVLSYNIPGVTATLNLTPEAIAGIYLGDVKKWNDPKIASANAGVKLPDSEIQVVHRSDGSGTSFIFTDYLSKVSPEWKSKVGSNTSVSWPLGFGGKGNDGVEGLVKQTPGSIGYVELIYAVQNKMAFANVKNAAGRFVTPSFEGVTEAAANSREMPRLHHQRAWRQNIPDLQLHLVAHSE